MKASAISLSSVSQDVVSTSLLSGEWKNNFVKNVNGFNNGNFRTVNSLLQYHNQSTSDCMNATKEKIASAVNSKQKNLTNLKIQKNDINNKNDNIIENKIIKAGNGKCSVVNFSEDNTKRKLRFPGDDDNENEDENSIINMIIEFTSEKSNVLFLASAFLCFMAGYMTNGLLGAFCSGVLILFIYKIIPEKT